MAYGSPLERDGVRTETPATLHTLRKPDASTKERGNTRAPHAPLQLLPEVLLSTGNSGSKSVQTRRCLKNCSAMLVLLEILFLFLFPFVVYL